MPQENVSRRYCEDCRFCEIPLSGAAYARCLKYTPRLGDVYVSRTLDQPGYAAAARIAASQCGPDGAWFEPAPAAATGEAA